LISSLLKGARRSWACIFQRFHLAGFRPRRKSVAAVGRFIQSLLGLHRSVNAPRVYPKKSSDSISVGTPSGRAFHGKKTNGFVLRGPRNGTCGRPPVPFPCSSRQKDQGTGWVAETHFFMRPVDTLPSRRADKSIFMRRQPGSKKKTKRYMRAHLLMAQHWAGFRSLQFNSRCTPAAIPSALLRKILDA